MPANMEKVKEESKNKREKVLEFLREHEGKGFTGEEIKERTGVPISDAISGRFPRFENIWKENKQEIETHPHPRKIATPKSIPCEISSNRPANSSVQT